MPFYSAYQITTYIFLKMEFIVMGYDTAVICPWFVLLFKPNSWDSFIVLIKLQPIFFKREFIVMGYDTAVICWWYVLLFKPNSRDNLLP